MPGAQTAALTAASKFLFFWASKGATAGLEGGPVNSLPSSSLLPSGMKQPWSAEERNNHYFTFVIRHSMLTQPADGQLVQAGQGSGLETAFHGAKQRRETLDFASGRELLN